MRPCGNAGKPPACGSTSSLSVVLYKVVSSTFEFVKSDHSIPVGCIFSHVKILKKKVWELSGMCHASQ